MIAPFLTTWIELTKGPAMIDTWFNTWIKYRSYILTSQSVLCHHGHHVFYGHFCLFFLSSCFFKNFFHPPRFVCFISFDSSKRVFYNHRPNTSFSLALPPFLSIFSSLFSFSSFLFLSSLLFLFFLSLPADFLVRRPPPCGTASDGPAPEVIPTEAR